MTNPTDQEHFEEFRTLLRQVLRENYPIGKYPYKVAVVVGFIALVEEKLITYISEAE